MIHYQIIFVGYQDGLCYKISKLPGHLKCPGHTNRGYDYYNTKIISAYNHKHGQHQTPLH